MFDLTKPVSQVLAAAKARARALLAQGKVWVRANRSGLIVGALVMLLVSCAL